MGNSHETYQSLSPDQFAFLSDHALTEWLISIITNENSLNFRNRQDITLLDHTSYTIVERKFKSFSIMSGISWLVLFPGLIDIGSHALAFLTPNIHF